MTNVVLYLRYSSDKQTEQSIEGQDRICRQYCERNDMCIVGTYIDRALSASKNTEKREEFQRMIKDSERGTFEAVVVYKLDRFARNRYDSATYKNKLKRNGVRVISATENITDSPEGIILESVLEGMAEFYSMELAQKVTRGMHETALKGNSCGGSIPLGFKVENKKLVIDPLTAPIVKEAFERYASGETIAEIYKSFNERGLRTAKGAKFNRNSFHNMFNNVKYIGTYKYKDVIIEDSLPAIIDKEIFEKVQARMQSNKTTPAKKKAKIDYLLTSKIFCGHCDSPMIGESGTGKNGRTYSYYTCAGRKRTKSCDKRPIPKDFIERVIVEDALALLSPEKIEEIASIAVNQIELENQENEIIPALEARLKTVNKSINNLLKLVEKGADVDSLFDRLKELEQQKKAITFQLDEEKRNIFTIEKTHIIRWLSQFSKGDIENEHFRRQVINLLVNSVTVWDEPDGWYRITSIYNLTSMNPTTFRCSDSGVSGPPKRR
ncbi:MAG: recombinase family protein [Ruminococcaceae bacterium]|nr:recombinase family protein [Oscillospiraceae bacterium]